MLLPYSILFIICLATSFLLSGMESGVLALSRLRIRQLMRKGNPRARALYMYLQDTERFLWTIMVGNTVSNIIVVSLGVCALYTWLLPWPTLFFATLLAAAMSFYAFFELLPKMVFRLFPNRLCLHLATPFRIIDTLLKPLVSLMALLSRVVGGRRFTGRLFRTREELRLVMQESAYHLTSEERGMINRVLDLQNLKISQVALPLDKAVTVDADVAVDQIKALHLEHGVNRFPVWGTDGGRRRIIGLVTMKSVLYGAAHERARTARDLMVKPLFLNGETRIEYALRQMQRHGHRLAILVDHDGAETGIVSLRDILKIIFGEVSL
jgi:CBS domain containing-hemolysin-like protein